MKMTHYTKKISLYLAFCFCLSTSTLAIANPETENETPSLWQRLMTTLGFGEKTNQEAAQEELATDTNKSNKFYEDALDRLANKEENAAILQLRNAIKYDKNNLSAYILLSKIYLERYDGISAERVLNRALEQGVDPKYLSKPLAQAYMQQFKFATLIEKINLNGLPKELRSELSLLKARAFLGLNQIEKAAEIVDRLLLNEPDNTLAKIERAVIDSTHDINQAKETLSSLPQEAELIADYWFVKSEISRQENRLEQAIKNLDQTLKIQPANLVYLQTRASLLLDTNQLEAGFADIQTLRKSFPEDLRSIMLEALYYQKTENTEQKDATLKSAYQIIEKLNFLKLQDDLYNLMLVANIFQLGGRLDEAENLLKRYLELKKQDLKAYHLLATIQLAKNQASLAKITLEKGLKVENNLSLLLLLAEAEMKQNNFKAAADIYSTIAQANPTTANIKQRLAFAKLAEGNQDEAIQLLNELIQEDKTNINNQILLAKIYLGISEFSKAISLCQKIIAKNPDLLAPYHLLGNAHLATNNLQEAKRYFSISLEKSPDFVPSLFNLASIDIKEDDTESAIHKLHQILKIDPENALAMNQLANIYSIRGDTEQEIEWREKALKIKPEIESGLRLVELYHLNNQTFHTEQTLKTLLHQHPENLKLLAAQAHLSLKANNPEKAKSTYNQMARIALEATSIHDVLNIIKLQRTAGDSAGASKTLQKAMTWAPDDIQLISASAEIDIAQNNYWEALKKANQIIKLEPDSPLGYLLAGDSESLLENPKAALQWYAKGIERSPSYEPLTLAYYRSLKTNENQTQATEFLEAWLNEHQQYSFNTLQALAAGYANLGKFEQAIKINEQLLNASPDNPAILNNLALLYLETNDSRALSFAEKAYQAQPDAYAILDTLGWVLTQTGQPEKGIAHLRNASARSFNSPDIQYHYAVALARTGDKKQATDILRKLLGSGKNFKEKSQAMALLNEIQ